MTALCTVEDIQNRLGRPLTTEEIAKADAAIADVSAFLYAQAPRIPDPAPAGVTGLAARLSMHVILADPENAGILSEGLGGYQVMYREGDFDLSDTDKVILRPYLRSKIGTAQIDPSMVAVGG